MKATPGTRIEVTEDLARQALDAVKAEVGPENVAISVGYVGLIPSSYPINAIYQWSGGPEEVMLRVALKPEAGVDVEALKVRLREVLSRRMPGVRTGTR